MNDNGTKCSDNSSEKECNNNSNCKWNKNVCINKNKHFLATNVGKITLIIIFMILSVILLYIKIKSSKKNWILF